MKTPAPANAEAGADEVAEGQARWSTGTYARWGAPV